MSFIIIIMYVQGRTVMSCLGTRRSPVQSLRLPRCHCWVPRLDGWMYKCSIDPVKNLSYLFTLEAFRRNINASIVTVNSFGLMYLNAER